MATSVPTVYLAGPIAHNTYDEASAWREYVQEDLIKVGIDCYSPLRGKEFLKERGKFLPTLERDNPLITVPAILGRDSFDVRRSDLIFVYLLGAPVISIGTIWEIGKAHELQKPILLVMEKTGNVHDHIMVTGSADFFVHDLKTAIYLTKTILLP